MCVCKHRYRRRQLTCMGKIAENDTFWNKYIFCICRLGAYHDGEAEAKSCSTQSGYIMSYTRDDSFKFSRFSPCSINSFQNFLRYVFFMIQFRETRITNFSPQFIIFVHIIWSIERLTKLKNCHIIELSACFELTLNSKFA